MRVPLINLTMSYDLIGFFVHYIKIWIVLKETYCLHEAQVLFFFQSAV